MIDMRMELIGALREAAEIEHGLMIQYLLGPLLPPRQGESEPATCPPPGSRWLLLVFRSFC
jgi:hypothetical protein